MGHDTLNTEDIIAAARAPGKTTLVARALFEATKLMGCWCSYGRGNPPLSDHTRACKAIQLFMETG